MNELATKFLEIIAMARTVLRLNSILALFEICNCVWSSFCQNEAIWITLRKAWLFVLVCETGVVLRYR